MKPFIALQESLRSKVEGLPHILRTDDEPDDANETVSETDSNEDKPEESNASE